MSDKELITIIVPVYNSERYLRDCIESILNQEYKNFELIIINDGSTDDSERICREYSQRDNRISLYSTDNYGQSHARNIGLDNSNGKYICFIDSDDMISPCYLSGLYKIIIDTNSDISVCRYNKVPSDSTYVEIFRDIPKVAEDRDNKDLTKKKALKRQNEEKLNFLTDLRERNWGPCCKLYRRKLLKDIRYDEQFKIEEDLLFNLFAFKAAEDIVCTDEKLYFYRTNPASVTKSKNYSDYFGAIQLLKNILDGDKASSGKEYYTNILTEYIETNLVLADIASVYEKDIRKNIYRHIRKNIKKYKYSRNVLKQYNKVLYQLFCCSDKIYLLALAIKKELKRLVINRR